MNRKTLLLIILLNAMLLASGTFFLLCGHQDDITLYDIPSSCSQSAHRFVGRTDALQSGIYTVTVYYTAEQDTYSIRCLAGKDDGKPYPLVLSESYTLSALYHDFSYRVWVTSNIDYLDVVLEGLITEELSETDSSFILDKIEISRDYRTTI